METLSPAVLILIFAGSVVLSLLVGYFIGSRFGGRNSVAMRETEEKHDGYRNDVREHFEQTAAIMSRMVDDYRDMYHHMADGAEKLAEMHPEKLVTPPPAPESITQDIDGRHREPAPGDESAKTGDTVAGEDQTAPDASTPARGGDDDDRPAAEQDTTKKADDAKDETSNRKDQF